MINTIFRPKKRFGQNFLVDKNILDKILDAASISNKDIILEIGPGKGVLTRELVKRAKQVISIEVDRKLFADLSKEFKGVDNIDIINKDILKFDLKQYLEKNNIEKVKLVANIPYSITSLILAYLFENINILNDIFIMLQKDLANRLIAKPGCKDYSSLTCFTQFYATPRILFDVASSCFRPRPKITSCLVNLKPDSRFKLTRQEEIFLFKIIRSAFNQRRKTILNSLSSISNKEDIRETLSTFNINERLRAENLSLEQYILLSSSLS